LSARGFTAGELPTDRHDVGPKALELGGIRLLARANRDVDRRSRSQWREQLETDELA
jgi:hypothetical protein